MKKILLTVSLTMAMFSSYTLGADCPSITPYQKNVLKFSYIKGRDYDLGETLATIAYIESSAGLYVLNPSTNDYGVYQGNYKTICIQSNLKPDSLQCSSEIQQVVYNIDVAADHAIETLQYWKSYHRNYQKMIRSYNAGFSFNSDAASNYWRKFKTAHKIIKRCFLPE